MTLASTVEASPTGRSIAIKFGTEQAPPLWMARQAS
jgi:hypothetical protein